MSLEANTKMTTQQLADWFGVSYSSFRKTSKDKYEELKYYCDYEKFHGGVEIKDVYVKDHSNKINWKTLEAYKKAIPENGIGTAAGAARQYVMNNIEVSLSTSLGNMRKAKTFLFGDKKNGWKGAMGTSMPVCSIKIDDYNHYDMMTDEQQEFFKKLNEEYAKKHLSRIARNEMAIQRTLEKKMTKEQLLEIILDAEEPTENAYYLEVIAPFKEKYAGIPTLATQHYIGEFQHVEKGDFNF